MGDAADLAMGGILCAGCGTYLGNGGPPFRRCGPCRKALKEATRKKKPGKLRKGDKANFETLRRACDADDLALVSAIRKADQTRVALVCAMQTNDDGTIMPVPLAVMVEGNPFDLFEDPTI